MYIISLVIQIFHTILTLFTAIFPHLYQKYDLYYVVYIFLVHLHWYIFKGECISTYFEKKLLDPSYKMGENLNWSPFYNIIGKSTMKILGSLSLINVCLVLYRNYNTKIFYPIIALLVLTGILLYLINKKYSYETNQINQTKQTKKTKK